MTSFHHSVIWLGPLGLESLSPSQRKSRFLVISWVSWHSPPHSTVISLSLTAFWSFVEVLNSGLWPFMSVPVKSQYLSSKSLFAMNSPIIDLCFAASHPKERRFYVCLRFSCEGCFHFPFFKKKISPQIFVENFMMLRRYSILFISFGQV